jgi:pilus assembly protein Flp/PilA
MLYLYLRAVNWIATRRESGQTLVEYALIIVLIAVVLIVALVALRGTISNAFSQISSGLSPT